MTIIAFLGSVFSPYYAFSRRFGGGDPLRHCALHVALYRTGDQAGPKRWTMTERDAGSVTRDATHLRIGPSGLRWDGSRLTIALDERTMPLPARVRGTVTLHPAAFTGYEAVLSETGNHRWTPLSPRARVEVALEDPSLRWSGDGYLDGNHGDGAIETAFRRWDWCRAPLGTESVILYEADHRGGGGVRLALRIDRNGIVRPIDPPPAATLSRSLWRVRRRTRSDDGWAEVRRTLVDAPFYARSLIGTRLLGQRCLAVHETLDCDRFANPAVQAMLPFRTPRAAW